MSVCEQRCTFLADTARLTREYQVKLALAYQCLTLLDLSQERLTQNDIACAEKLFGINASELKSPSHKPLVNQWGNGYVTAHGELYRVLKNLKFLPFKEYSYVAEVKIIENKGMPLTFTRFIEHSVHVYELVQKIYDNLSERHKIPNLEIIGKILDVIACAFQQDGVSLLSEYQATLIEKVATDILSGRGNNLTYMVDAPTGTGKTEIFLFAVLLNALLGKRSVVIYPRKTLESDQAQRAIRRLYHLSKCIASSGETSLRVPTLLIVDGDHPYSYEYGQHASVGVAEATGKGLLCPECGQKLSIQFLRGGYTVACPRGHRVDYVRLFKDDVINSPSIIFTNRYLLLTNAIKEAQNPINAFQRGFFKNLTLMVFDEAHVYTNLEGGDLALTIQIVKNLTAQYSERGDGNLRIILSSATVPNPVEFASRLTGVRQDQVFYVDYYDQKFRSDRYRASMVIPAMTTPRFSAETLLQLVILVSMLWLRKYGYKGIVFIDSRAEVGRIYHYIKETILEKGGLRDDLAIPGDLVIYHTSEGVNALKQRKTYANNNIDHEALWDSLINPGEAQKCVSGKGNCDLISDLKREINMTFAWEEKAARESVFTWFKQPGWKLLVSTSSTELGIDIGDVSLVIQYKPPIRSEGFIQRIGRAGRDIKTTMGIATGILVLSQSLSSAMYMYDDFMQARLVDIRKAPPYLVNISNESLHRRAVIYQALANALSQGKRSYWPKL